jgi:hypothetical protein
MDEDLAPTRKGSPAIKVRVLPAEKEQIEELARATGLSASSYLRLVGLGYQPRSVVDLDKVQELVAINGDLGRLGGLLKLWLSDDAKLAEMEPEKMHRIIRGVLEKIEANQAELREVARAVLKVRQR